MMSNNLFVMRCRASVASAITLKNAVFNPKNNSASFSTKSRSINGAMMALKKMIALGLERLISKPFRYIDSTLDSATCAESGVKSILFTFARKSKNAR